MRSPAPALPRPSPADESGLPANENLQVLIVEDEPSAAYCLKEILRAQFGCVVDVAANGVAAFERLAQTRYALVVSDIRMASMNGPELFLWLREAQPATAQRFVFVTAYPGETDFEADLLRWGVPVVAKPYTIAELLAACGPYLNGNRD